MAQNQRYPGLLASTVQEQVMVERVLQPVAMTQPPRTVPLELTTCPKRICRMYTVPRPRRLLSRLREWPYTNDKST